MRTQLEYASTSVVESLESKNESTVRARFDSDCIQSVERMKQIVADAVNVGRTFQVTKEVYDHFSQKLHVLPKPPDDIQRINRLLGLALDENDPCGVTGTNVCPHCGHEVSFADHIEAALRMGLHTVDGLKRLFVAGDKYVLTVVADVHREMLCVKCGVTSAFPRFCYRTSTYCCAEAD
ncbi:MAG TPA: hypothetical protein VFV58_09000 [Blastocatellia bacterium]|jgi:hypothetical protein|nr:hypothetical protein [Blastocatellia bacterium]